MPKIFSIFLKLRNAQGIEAVSFFAGGKKDTSVKPGPGAVLPCGQVGARMRPEYEKQDDANCYTFALIQGGAICFYNYAI
jgi:hypothetical protein